MPGSGPDEKNAGMEREQEHEAIGDKTPCDWERGTVDLRSRGRAGCTVGDPGDHVSESEHRGYDRVESGCIPRFYRLQCNPERI